MLVHTAKCFFVVLPILCFHIKGKWPRGLRRDTTSPAQTLGLRVRFPLEAWMSVCLYSVFVLSCVGSGLATGRAPVGVLPTVCKIRNRPEGIIRKVVGEEGSMQKSFPYYCAYYILFLCWCPVLKPFKIYQYPWT
jgi:hypothetical protein